MSNNLKIHPKIEVLIPTVKAVTDLMFPFVEAAIHDLTIGRLIAIYNNISKRKIGDKTPLQELGTPVENFPDYFDPYYKTNWDGKKLKCTSITVRDENGIPVGLICFNFDTTFFTDIEDKIHTFLKVKPTADNPIELFAEDWRVDIRNFVKQYLKDNRKTVATLSGEEKKQLVEELFEKGVFNFKNSTNYIAELLDISRATVYNYLKEI